MRAIITRKDKYGEYTGIGMNNRTVSGNYKLLRNLIRYGIPDNFLGKLRLEIYNGESIAGEPAKIIFVERNLRKKLVLKGKLGTMQNS